MVLAAAFSGLQPTLPGCSSKRHHVFLLFIAGYVSVSIEVDGKPVLYALSKILPSK